jgi:hypothetical protein
VGVRVPPASEAALAERPLGWASATVLAAGVGILAVAISAGAGVQVVAILVLGLSVLLAVARALLRWQNLLALIILVVMFVPIGFYDLPGHLPFNFELYRLLVAIVLFLWVTSLLIDPSLALQRSAFDFPVALLVTAVVASLLANRSRVDALGSEVVKSLIFFLSFVLTYYFIVSVVRTRAIAERTVRILVSATTVVAFFATVERRTGYNVFYHLHSVLPFLRFNGGGLASERGGNLRVFASAQHPIALGAAFAMSVPLSIFLARTSSKLWLLSTLLLLLGLAGTASRTPVVMLIVCVGVFLWLKPRETVRWWPVLLPMVVLVHVAVPGALGTFEQAFFPAGGIVAQQTELPQNGNLLLAGGRLRQLGPELSAASSHPFFGIGSGTRQTGFANPKRNAPILDNQWLDTLLEIGLIGAGALLWLMIRSVRLLGAAARRVAHDDDDGWLYTALAASIASFGVGLFFYDAFSFIQVTFVFWITLALAAAFLSIDAEQRVGAPTAAPAH